MGRCNVVLPHYAFFEALAECTDENSAEWRATSAGLVTLRLFDDWVRDGANAVTSDSWTLRAVRDAIAAIDPGNTARALLTSLVDSMQLARHARVAVVAPRLLAYARALQFEARWALAADVYQTVLVSADPVSDADVVIVANMQLGACQRVLGKWNDAREAYETAAEVATLTGDVMNVLKARIAEGNVAMARGNLPAAERILDTAIEGAEENGLHELRALAIQDRGVVARHRGDLETAARFAYEALSALQNQVARDRALADLAAIFFDMGILSAARDANLVLAATAQEQYTRWVATINLLEIAAVDQREPVFEQYRRELAEASLPVTLAAYYFYYVGEGYRRFERMEQARVALGRAIEVASRHSINEVLIKAEKALADLRMGGVIITSATPDAASETIAGIVSAIHEMRTLAGVGG